MIETCPSEPTASLDAIAVGRVTMRTAHGRTRLLAAGVGRMTPALRAADRAGVAYEVLEYTHRADAESYGLEAAAALGLPPEVIFKTLVAKD